jgi:hypothetical protein
MNVSTTSYEFTYGRKPRGEAHWAFQFYKGGSDTIAFAPSELSYGKAKQWAIAKAQELGADRVSVCT